MDKAKTAGPKTKKILLAVGSTRLVFCGASLGLGRRCTEKESLCSTSASTNARISTTACTIGMARASAPHITSLIKFFCVYSIEFVFEIILRVRRYYTYINVHRKKYRNLRALTLSATMDYDNTKKKVGNWGSRGFIIDDEYSQTSSRKNRAGKYCCDCVQKQHSLLYASAAQPYVCGTQFDLAQSTTRSLAAMLFHLRSSSPQAAATAQDRIQHHLIQTRVRSTRCSISSCYYKFFSVYDDSDSSERWSSRRKVLSYIIVAPPPPPPSSLEARGHTLRCSIVSMWQQQQQQQRSTRPSFEFPIARVGLGSSIYIPITEPVQRVHAYTYSSSDSVLCYLIVDDRKKCQRGRSRLPPKRSSSSSSSSSYSSSRRRWTTTALTHIYAELLKLAEIANRDIKANVTIGSVKFRVIYTQSPAAAPINVSMRHTQRRDGREKLYTYLYIRTPDRATTIYSSSGTSHTSAPVGTPHTQAFKKSRSSVPRAPRHPRRKVTRSRPHLPPRCAAQRARIRIHVPGTASGAVAAARRFGVNARAASAAIRRVALASIFASRSCRVDFYILYTRCASCNKRNSLTSSTRSSSSLYYYTAFWNCIAKRSSFLPRARQSSAKKKRKNKITCIISITSELERWIGLVEEEPEQLQHRSSLRDSAEEHLLQSLYDDRRHPH
ncbi:unnamed protein product [Trichogramma brassicae]|uniref:Uncharacterized protein n=1 Tax=Trichogramma brassicae TaxID=86971 RepID=A0A6H5IUF4_9HYME|nr:unnamed protein product [Trichogramma brassicae]